MTITVSKPDKVNVCEDGKREFKSSIFFAPGEKLPVLKQMREIAASIFVYDGTTDKYQLKIRHILQAFLSPNHRNYLGEIRFAKMGETNKRVICRIDVKKCSDDDFVYFIAKDKINGLVIDGKHAGDVKSWKECYQRLCCELNKMGAARFDSLPDDEFFCKRAVEVPGKVCFYDEDKSCIDFLRTSGFSSRKCTSALVYLKRSSRVTCDLAMDACLLRASP